MSPEPITVAIREIANGRYRGTYTDPTDPSVSYIIETFQRLRIVPGIQHMIAARKERHGTTEDREGGPTSPQ